MAQNKNIHLSIKVNSKSLNEVTIQKTGLRSSLGSNPDFTIPIKLGRGSLDTTIVTDGLYRIADAIDGHIIYLEAGDSALISLKTRNDLKINLANHIYMKYFHNLSASGKYSWHYTFFDFLDKRTEGILFGKKNNRQVNTPAELMSFKESCDKVLYIGNVLLDSLVDLGLVSKAFFNVVNEELNAMYVSNICSYLTKFKRKNIPPAFFEKLNQFSFNDSVYAVQCYTYIQAGSLYTYYIHNEFNPYNFYSNLVNEIGSIKNNYTGIIKDKLLTTQISDYIDKRYPLFDSCYKIYLNECNSETYKYTVAKKIIEYKLKVTNVKKIEFNEMISRSYVLNTRLKRIPLRQIFADSMMTLFDCWATWCVPCKKQLPYIDSIKSKFKGRLNIVFFSMDNDKKKWMAYLSKNKEKANHYLLTNDFKSLFAQYFNIEQIPRYILFSKTGKTVLNTNMPLPSMQEDFIEELLKFSN